MSYILDLLIPGDLRTIGKSQVVAQKVLENPELFGELFDGLSNTDPGVRMRSADSLEKVSRERPDLLQPYVAELIHLAIRSQQKEVGWHLAQMFSYVELDETQQELVTQILTQYYEGSSSNIVKVMSLQTLYTIAGSNKKYQHQIIQLLKGGIQSTAPSVRSRAAKLMKLIQSKSDQM